MSGAILFSSIFPPVFIMALIFVCAWIFSKKLPFYRDVSVMQEKGRYEALDGLRGFLALGVLFQHAATNYTYFTTGIWEITPYSMYRHFGGEAVILFFMITSFLYWSKAIVSKGEVNAGKLYKSRFYRLAPMYLFSAAIVTVVALVMTDFNIQSFGQFVRDIFSWLTLGLTTTLSVNGYNIVPINAGIHWTLHFEWFFYLLLPIAALALQHKTMRILVLPLVFYALSSDQWGYWVIFFFGIAAAHVVAKYPSVPALSRFSAGVLPIIGLVLVYFIQYEPYSVLQYCVTFLIFLCFVYGNDLFGLLKTSAARFLGTISYSMYLLHGIVITAVFNTFDALYPLSSMSAAAFWMMVACAGIFTVSISAVTYRYVEYPFLRKIHPKKAETSPIEIEERVI